MSGRRDEALADRLLALAAGDAAKRDELVTRGELFDGYHPEMESVHRENAAALARELDADGWPGVSRVGKEAAGAAWLVAQHAIGQPAFQRRCLALLQDAGAAGEVPLSHAAALEDRIRFNERRPQRFGTILDWDESGELAPWTVADPLELPARRQRVGLPPLDEAVRGAREQCRREGARPPADIPARLREIEDWARRAGWLDE